MNIQEDYVSFETAKLLKEKGFDEKCFYVWVNADNQTPSLLATANFVEGAMATNKAVLDVVTQYHMITYESNNKIESFLCPTLQMVMRWLREVHNIMVSPYALSLGYYFEIFDLTNRDITGCKPLYQVGIPNKETVLNTYEESVEAAIKYCLENLI